MHRLAITGLVALGGLLSACQSQRQVPPEGAQVEFVLQMMVESAKIDEGPVDANRAVRAVEGWRTGEAD